MPDKSKCWACNNMDGYWEEKARREAAEKGGLRDQIGQPTPLGQSRAPEAEAEGQDDECCAEPSAAETPAEEKVAQGEGV